MTTDRQRDKVAAELMAAYRAEYDEEYRLFHPDRQRRAGRKDISMRNRTFIGLRMDIEALARHHAHVDKERDLKAVCDPTNPPPPPKRLDTMGRP